MQIKNRVKELRLVKASEIIANPKNWRQHPKSQSNALKGMLSEIGYADALVAYETSEGLMLIDGHLRAETTPDMEVPVLVTDLNEQEADKLLVTLDPLGAMARSDRGALDELLGNMTLQDQQMKQMLSNIRARTEFETEYIDPRELHPHPRNYVKHPQDQLDHLVESIRENGLYRNIVVAQDNTIIAGHGVVEASLQVPLDSVAIIRIDVDSEDPKALKLLASDNEISHLGEVDDRALTEMLREIKETTPNGLLGTGYNDQMLANLLMVTRTQDEIKDFDTAAEWVGMPDFEGVTQEDRLQITMYFEDEVARGRFMSQVKDTIPNFSPIKKSERAWYEWYPHKGNEDVGSVKFVSSENDG
jgi:hypothetical protein|tara:strand:- start:18 stop:1097 length:1080 start_codon:yes stop_codon:yes gene_type:complete